jgi:hypothetical protein
MLQKRLQQQTEGCRCTLLAYSMQILQWDWEIKLKHTVLTVPSVEIGNVFDVQVMSNFF